MRGFKTTGSARTFSHGHALIRNLHGGILVAHGEGANPLAVSDGVVSSRCGTLISFDQPPLSYIILHHRRPA